MSGPAVVVDGLSKHYGKVAALDGLSFEVPADSIVGLLGPNGSGKTTTVAILSTALRPGSGRAYVCDRDVRGDPAAVRRLIGLAGQYAAVDPNLTGAENLTLVARLSRVPRSQSRRRAWELLERFGLVGAADRLVRTYSGGMRRRLDLAAALVHHPKVLLLDEPTTGLDPESRRMLWDSVRDLAGRGTTVLLTTQYLEEADVLASSVVILDHGRAVEVGTPATLKSRVGATVVELTFPDGDRAAAAAGRLVQHRFQAAAQGSAVQVRASSGSRAVVDVLRTLGGSDAAITGVTIRQPTLDDVFLTLTGPGRGGRGPAPAQLSAGRQEGHAP